jgi:hypothetical protein
MSCIRKNQDTCRHQCFLHVDDYDCEIKKFQLLIQILQLLQNSHIIIQFFFHHEAKTHIKSLMQARLITDDHQEHLVLIRLVSTIHY